MREGCPFCLENGLLVDAPVHETDHFFILMSADAALPRAAMVIPRRHSESPFEMNLDEWRDLPAALSGARAALDQFAPQGYCLGWNVGAVGGQTIPHTHLHVIARFSSDPMAGKGIRHAFKTSTGVEV
jgi:diadenosine tetraphosphate (Ap4A) HIT family hydrolase